MKSDNLPRNRTRLIAASLILLVAVSMTGCRQGDAGASSSSSSKAMGQPLTSDQQKLVDDAVARMQAVGLVDDARLAKDLLAKKIWKAATVDDQYLKDSEKAGFTPYAYTLSDGKQPSAIVLGPRYFTEATPNGRSALMIHELGHYRAYVATGKSDETDGYKVEYDTHAKLGLTESDGLVYFSMLDGVEEYVVPKFPVYKTYADVKAYMNQ